MHETRGPSLPRVLGGNVDLMDFDDSTWRQQGDVSFSGVAA
jgi:hypothetical protein